MIIIIILLFYFTMIKKNSLKKSVFLREFALDQFLAISLYLDNFSFGKFSKKYR